MKKTIFILLLLPMSVFAQANIFESGNFESGKLSDSIGWNPYKSVKLIKGAAEKGKSILSLPGLQKTSCRTRAIKISQLNHYELSFYAKINEDDFFLGDVVFNKEVWRNTQSLPQWHVQFYTDIDCKKRIPISGIHYRRFDNKIIANTWQKYTIPFYVPSEAKAMTVQFSNGKDMYALLIDDISVAPVKKRTVNLNPDFSLGQYNYSGYNCAHKSWIEPEEAQQGFYMDCSQGHVIGDPIPLEKGNYSIAITAKPVKQTSRLAKRKIPRFYIDFYDEKMKRISQKIQKTISFRWRPTNKEWKTHTYDFAVRDQVKFIRFRFGGGYFDKIVFTKEK